MKNIQEANFHQYFGENGGGGGGGYCVKTELMSYNFMFSVTLVK